MVTPDQPDMRQYWTLSISLSEDFKYPAWLSISWQLLLPCPVQYCPMMPCPIQRYLILPYLILPYLILPYHILPQLGHALPIQFVIACVSAVLVIDDV